METKPHTIFLLVGPSGCGKTYFATNYLKPALQAAFPSEYPANIQYISSDAYRIDVLGKFHHKHDPIMLFASEAAFSLLFRKLELVTSYPINAEFVIVDTTGLSVQFRKDVVKIAQKNNYRIEMLIFDYKTYEEYTKYTEDTHDKKIIYSHIKRMRTEVYPDLRARDYDNIVRIKNKDFSQIQFSFTGINELVEHYLTERRECYDIISDVHGCYDSLLELLRLRGFSIAPDLTLTGNDKVTLILIGDWIDKGIQTEQIIRFLHKNPTRILLIKGNHENFVYKYLKGILKEDTLDEESKKFFDTIDLLNKVEFLKEMFFDLIDRSFEFWRHRDFIVTHAPCLEKYLGKVDSVSLGKQRNFRAPHAEQFRTVEAYRKKLNSVLQFLVEEASVNKPKHIFGHLACSTPLYFQNKINIDTGCVNGGKLTAAYFDGHKLKFAHSTPMKNPPLKEDLYELLTETEFNQDLLGQEDWRRIKALCESKVNYISGTMSPSDKEGYHLETVRKALSYYKEKGVVSVIMQIKHMGSRANLYLPRKDLIENGNHPSPYMVSRNGFLIKALELTSIYNVMGDKLSSFMADRNFDWLLVDGELMPWSALGKGLIDQHFLTVDKGIGSELAILEQTNFEAHLNSIYTEYKQSSFSTEVNTVSKKDLIKKYGNTKYGTYSILNRFNYPHLEPLKGLHKTYHSQMELYAQPSEMSFEPFALLKGIRPDGSEHVFVSETESNIEQYSMLSENPYLVLDLTDLDLAIEKAQQFFHFVISLKKEGVVIKPDQVYIPGIAPYLKVRNPDYLSIIYGYDYTLAHKMEKLLKQKSTRRKMATSINEFDIGRQLLHIPRKEISIENKKYLALIASMSKEEQIEKTLDPRL